MGNLRAWIRRRRLPGSDTSIAVRLPWSGPEGPSFVRLTYTHPGRHGFIVHRSYYRGIAWHLAAGWPVVGHLWISWVAGRYGSWRYEV